MADLRCQLQQSVDANREVLNNRAEDQRVRDQVTQSQQQTPGTAQAKRGTAEPEERTVEIAKAKRSVPLANEVNDQADRSQRLELKAVSRKRGVARLADGRQELGVRRLDGGELEPIFITYNTPSPIAEQFNNGGLLFYDLPPEGMAQIEIGVVSADRGELTRFKPFELDRLNEPAEQRIDGEAQAVSQYVAGLVDTQITGSAVTFTQEARLGMDFPVISNNTLVLTFLRQRWVSYRVNYVLTAFFNGNPITEDQIPLTALNNCSGDVLVVKVNLETGDSSHQARPYWFHEVKNVSNATAAGSGSGVGWRFDYQRTETLEDLAVIVSELSGFDQLFASCAPGLFSTPKSNRYVHAFSTSATGQRLGLPQDEQFQTAEINLPGLFVHSAYLLMSRPARLFRDSSALAQPRWVGLDTTNATRVLVSPAGDYLERSDYSLDLSDCEQVGWLDDYWASSFAGLNGDLAEPDDVFVQEAIPLLPDAEADSNPTISPKNPDAPAEPYDATVVKNIPYITRAALTAQVGDPITWVLYRVV